MGALMYNEVVFAVAIVLWETVIVKVLVLIDEKFEVSFKCACNLVA